MRTTLVSPPFSLSSSLKTFQVSRARAKASLPSISSSVSGRGRLTPVNMSTLVTSTPSELQYTGLFNLRELDNNRLFNNYIIQQ